MQLKVGKVSGFAPATRARVWPYSQNAGITWILLLRTVAGLDGRVQDTVGYGVELYVERLGIEIEVLQTRWVI